MCKVEMLKALLHARLNAAVEEVFVAFARTIAEYEEQLSRSKQENERQRQLLDSVFRPPYEAHPAVVGGEVLPQEHLDWNSMAQQQEPEPLHHIEEEVEDTYQVKKEEEEVRLPSPEMPFPHVVVKTEYAEDGSSQCVTAEGGGGGVAPRRDAKPFMCSVCGKRFGQRAHLTTHTRIHTGDKPFSCPVCTKAFIDYSAMIKHTRIHTGEKPFACTFCGLAFSDRSNLGKHMRRHTGEKPFACSVCSLTFSDRSNLVKHMRRHTGEKPFACSVCSLTFRDRSNLSKHMRRHTGEKPFACAVCALNFRDRSTLVQHVRTHVGENGFHCHVCGKQFSQRGALAKHVLVHSGEEIGDVIKTE